MHCTDAGEILLRSFFSLLFFRFFFHFFFFFFKKLKRNRSSVILSFPRSFLSLSLSLSLFPSATFLFCFSIFPPSGSSLYLFAPLSKASQIYLRCPQQRDSYTVAPALQRQNGFRPIVKTIGINIVLPLLGR